MAKKTPKAACIFGADFMHQQVTNLKNEFVDAQTSDDIEIIHRIRVASRRLRTGFEFFGECLPKKKGKEWEDGIRQLTRALGNARDLDIQINLLNHLYEDALNTKFKPGYSRLLLRLKQRRAKAQNKVDRSINYLRELNLLDKMDAYLAKISAASQETYLFTPSLYQKAFNAIRHQLDDFLSLEKYIYSPENVEKLHAMRISGKHLRYTIEIFAPVYNQALLPYIQTMKEIQDTLGEIHDCDVWISWLPDFIEKEKTRVEDYFGNTGPLKRLLPGIHNLIENRTVKRAEEYQAFLSMWETLKAENAWELLKEIIKAPIDVETALENIVAEVEPNACEESQQIEPSDQGATPLPSQPTETQPESEISPSPPGETLEGNPPL